MTRSRLILVLVPGLALLLLMLFVTLRDPSPPPVPPPARPAPAPERLSQTQDETSPGTSQTQASDPAAQKGRTATAADRGPAEAMPNKQQALIEDPRFVRRADGRSELVESVSLSQKLSDKSGTGPADLEAIESIVGAYLWAYKELPEGGENHEIVSGLTGTNPKHLIFIPPDHPRLDTRGNLTDRWGTPYFFHKQSDTELGVISAGPDKRLWSTDDLRSTHATSL